MDKKNISIENFIGVYDNYVPKEVCKEIINYFENKKKFNLAFDRIISENSGSLEKKDKTVFLNFDSVEEWFESFKPLFVNFDVALKHYVVNSGLEKTLDSSLKYTTIRIQKTLPGEGYHIWHVEKAANLGYINRILAFTIYLNDVENGGETEFLYQSQRVKPVTGRIVIWPSGFPYVHRGNPPLKGEKYIITSWMLV
jgi:hypothetical protein